MYNSPLSLTSGLGGVGGQSHVLSLYPPERPGTHCTGSRVGHSSGLDGCGKFAPTGIRSWAVQFVASRYTD